MIMTALLYFGSIAFSLLNLVMVLLMMFADENLAVFKFFGYTECYTCIGISIVLLVIGYINDNKTEENYDD